MSVEDQPSPDAHVLILVDGDGTSNFPYVYGSAHLLMQIQNMQQEECYLMLFKVSRQLSQSRSERFVATTLSLMS